jgi:hypothetical protein
MSRCPDCLVLSSWSRGGLGQGRRVRMADAHSGSGGAGWSWGAPAVEDGLDLGANLVSGVGAGYLAHEGGVVVGVLVADGGGHGEFDRRGVQGPARA